MIAVDLGEGTGEGAATWSTSSKQCCLVGTSFVTPLQAVEGLSV